MTLLGHVMFLVKNALHVHYMTLHDFTCNRNHYMIYMHNQYVLHVFTCFLHVLHWFYMTITWFLHDDQIWHWFFFFVVHSQPDQCSWENPLKTIHLDGCCLSSCNWSRIHVGWTRGQFQRCEEHWADDGMQWLPLWGMEWADSNNAHWVMVRPIRGGDSLCSRRPYTGQAGRGQNVGRPGGLPHLLLSSKPLSDTFEPLAS